MLVQIQHMAQKEHKRRMNQDASSAHCPVAKRYGSLGVVPCKALLHGSVVTFSSVGSLMGATSSSPLGRFLSRTWMKK